MKSRFFALFFMAALVLNAVPLATAESVELVPEPLPANALVAMLPASDAVVAFDTKRFFSDALPRVLASNQPMLGKIVGEVDKIASQTGIDLRKFENIAVGATMKPTPKKGMDIDFVAIARGEMNPGALIAMAKLAANGKYREAKIGTQTAYVFSLKDAMKKAQPKGARPKAAEAVNDAVSGMPTELAVVSTDRNTLVVGSVARVTQTLERTSALSAELGTLMSERAPSILAFAVQLPEGMTGMIPVPMDEVGKNIAGIRVAAGSMDVTAAGVALDMMVRTQRPEQAKNLSDMLNGLQMMGGGMLSNSQKPDQQVFGRLVKGARLGHTGSDVTLNLAVAQSDVDFLVGLIK
jgi:hypothetical protein